jgi:hypothetical protein
MQTQQGLFVPYRDNPAYLENQWAEDTLVGFEREHGEEGEHVQNLAGILCHFARWCDASGLQLSEALKIAATRYSEETDWQGRQFFLNAEDWKAFTDEQLHPVMTPSS